MVVEHHGLGAVVQLLVGHHQAVRQRVSAGGLDDLLVELRGVLGWIGLEGRFALGAAELHLGPVEILVLHARKHDGDGVRAELLARNHAGVEWVGVALELISSGNG